MALKVFASRALPLWLYALALCSLSYSSTLVAKPRKCKDLANKAEAVEAIRPARVTKHIPGLFESIPYPFDLIAKESDPYFYSLPRLRIGENLEVVDSRSGNSLKTEVFYTDPESGQEIKGTVVRNVSDGKVVLDSAYLDGVDFSDAGDLIALPRWINEPGLVPLVPGRGIPLQAYLTIRQLKMAGTEISEIRVIKSEVTNVVTAAQYEVEKRRWKDAHPGEKPSKSVKEEWLRRTHTILYTETVLSQLEPPLKIKDIEFEEYDAQPADQWIESTVKAAGRNNADPKQRRILEDIRRQQIANTGLAPRGKLSVTFEIKIRVKRA